jgi:hypothetical protein
MNQYRIVYIEYDQESGIEMVGIMYYDGNDERHAVNQLLDFYKDLECRVSCVFSVTLSPLRG